MPRCKVPILQTAFCGHSIYTSCVCMAWVFLAIDVFMTIISIFLVIVMLLQAIVSGDIHQPPLINPSTYSQETDWITQVSELTLSYAVTNLLVSIAWLFMRTALLLGLYRESANVLFLWCILSLALMSLQLVHGVGVSVLLLAARRLGDAIFLAGCALTLLQLLVYVDAHIYLTLMAYSVKELILKKRMPFGTHKFSTSPIRFSRVSMSNKRPTVLGELRASTIQEKLEIV